MSKLRQMPINELFDDLNEEVDAMDDPVRLWPAMDDNQKRKHMAKLMEEEMHLFSAGQKEYARTENMFANFNRIAQALDVSPERVLMVYAMKHLDGILAWVNGHRSQRESVLGRINDLRVYLALLHLMVEAYDGGYVSENPETV